jgi:hypothetical protein
MVRKSYDLDNMVIMFRNRRTFIRILALCVAIYTKYSQLLKRNFTITEKCKIQLHFLISKPCDVIVSMFASNMVDRGLESLFGQTIYHNIGTSLLHTRLRSNDNEWVIII